MRIAETAFEVISLCRLISISSGDGAGSAGSAGAAALSDCVAFGQLCVSSRCSVTYEDSPLWATEIRRTTRWAPR